MDPWHLQHSLLLPIFQHQMVLRLIWHRNSPFLLMRWLRCQWMSSAKLQCGLRTTRWHASTIWMWQPLRTQTLVDESYKWRVLQLLPGGSDFIVDRSLLPRSPSWRNHNPMLPSLMQCILYGLEIDYDLSLIAHAIYPVIFNVWLLWMILMPVAHFINQVSRPWLIPIYGLISQLNGKTRPWIRNSIEGCCWLIVRTLMPESHMLFLLQHLLIQLLPTSPAGNNLGTFSVPGNILRNTTSWGCIMD